MSNEPKQPAWARLGFEREVMDGLARNLSTFTELWDGPPWEPLRDISSLTMMATMLGMFAFASGSLGYTIEARPWNDWRAAGARTVDWAVNYFFGDWRDQFIRAPDDQIDRRRARLELEWSDIYREGLTIAASLSDWASVDKLLAWPGPDLPKDEGTDDRTSDDNAYQVWLAARLRGEPVAASAAQRAAIEGGTRRRPKMLLAAADALLDGDAQRLQTALQTYLRHYRKLEIEPRRVDMGVSADANALWHLARRRGLGEIELPEELMILIARP